MNNMTRKKTTSSSCNGKRQGIVNAKSSVLTLATAIVLLGAIFVMGFEDVSVEAAKGAPGKPIAVQLNSNGFPSGPHINLNIHGRDLGWNGCQDVEGPPKSDDNDLGKNINAPLDGTGNILFVSNKKSTNTDMTVWDNCTENVHILDTDPAKVQIPPNGIDGWFVYWRMQAGNSNNQELANVTLTPNLNLLAMCNDDPDNPIIGFSEFNDCQDTGPAPELVMPILQVSTGGISDPDGEKITKWDQIGKGKNRQLAADVTDLFMWSGSVCNSNLDFTGDGSISLSDFNVTNNVGGDPDGVVNASDFEALIAAGLISQTVDDDPTNNWTTAAELMALIDFDVVNEIVDPGAEFTALLNLIAECLVFEDDIWIFTAADIVEHGFDYENHGSKLTQIRFYNASATNVIR